MAALMRKHPFWMFYGIAIGLPTVLFTYMLVLEVGFPELQTVDTFYGQQEELLADNPLLFHHRDSVWLYLTGYVLFPLAAPFLFFPFAPTVAACVVTAASAGKDRLLKLLSLYKPVQGSLSAMDGVRLYALMLLMIAAMVALLVLWESLYGDAERLEHMLHTVGTFDLKYLMAGFGMALLFNQGGLLEELGWRGYAYPLLMRTIHKPLLVAVLVGTAWTFWHLPREIPPLLSGESTFGTLLPQQALFWTGCVGCSIVITAFVNMTGGSVLPAIMIHGLFNHMGAAVSVDRVGVRSEIAMHMPVMWSVAAVVTLILVGRDVGWHRRVAIQGGEDVSFAHLPSRSA